MIRETTKVRTERAFSAAHFLPNHSGKCKYLHGHTWRVEVEITAAPGQLDGKDMIVDFGDIKRIIDEYDHDFLNKPQRGQEPIENPTAENLAALFAIKISKLFDKPLAVYEKIVIKVYESPESFAEVIFEDTKATE
jgi:6-pyruvoyltetrahydropterin/6-carboxytetrahydropterin synthase